MPVKIVFRCEVCGARPDPATRISLECMLLDLRHGEYVDAAAGGSPTWHGRPIYGPRVWPVASTAANSKAQLREHYGSLGWHPWARDRTPGRTALHGPGPAVSRTVSGMPLSEQRPGRAGADHLR